GAALGRRDERVLGGSPDAEVALRTRCGLAALVGGPRAPLLRGRAAARRVGGARAAARGPALRALSDGSDAALLQPRRAEGVGGEERHSVPGDAAGEEHEAVRRPVAVPALQHL